MSVAIKTAIKEIASGILDVDVSRLSSFCQRLYDASKNIPLNKNEVARYHICAFLTIDKYRTDTIPDPDISRIPLPPSVSKKLVEDFRLFLNEIRSPSRLPLKERPISDELLPSTPTRKGRMQSSPLSQGGRISKSSNKPLKSSPLKKLQALADSPTPSSSKESSPLKDTNSPFISRKTFYPSEIVHITFPELIRLCNTFYIPNTITKELIQCFINKRHKFTKKSDWYLACGLVFAAYTRINHELAKKNAGFQDTVMKQLKTHQRGHLNYDRMGYWASMVNNDIKEERWIINIEKMYMHKINLIDQHEKELKAKLGEDYMIYDKLGSMISLRNNLLTETQSRYFENWSTNVLNELK